MEDALRGRSACDTGKSLCRRATPFGIMQVRGSVGEIPEMVDTPAGQVGVLVNADPDDSIFIRRLRDQLQSLIVRGFDPVTTAFEIAAAAILSKSALQNTSDCMAHLL